MDRDEGFAEANGGDVAFHVYGGAPDRTFVVMYFGVLPVSAIADDPVSLRFVTELCRMGSVVLFDRRGVGASSELPDDTDRLDGWVADLEAVVRTAGARDVVVLAHSVAANAAVVAAARGAAPLTRLVLAEPFNPWVRAADLERANAVTALLESDAADYFDVLLPDRAGDEAARRWWVRAGHAGAGPSAARRLTAGPDRDEMLAVRAAYRSLTVPTLVLRRRLDHLVSEDVHEAADRRLNATRRVVLRGRDWFTFNGAGLDEVVSHVAEFVTGRVLPVATSRRLRAVLFSDIAGSTSRLSEVGDETFRQVLDRHDASVERAVGRDGGEVVKFTGDGVLALFESATDAVNAAASMGSELAGVGIVLRSGIHVGDVELRDGDVSGIAVNIAARVMGVGEPGDITVTRTAADASLGADIDLGDPRVTELRGVPGEWEVRTAHPR